MVPSDSRKTNFTVDQTLVVGKLITAPVIQVQDLKVTQTLSIEDLNLDELNVNTIHASTVNTSGSSVTDGVATFTTVNAENGNFTNTNVTNEEVKNLNATTIEAINTNSTNVNAAHVNGTQVNGIHINGTNVNALTLSATDAKIMSLILSNTVNQLVFTTGNPGNTITVTAPTATASRIFTLPDVASGSFLMTEGAQTAPGVKTFSNGVLFGTTGGTPTNLNFYSEATQTPFTLTGPFASGTVNVTIALARVGKMVTMNFTGFTTAAGGVGSTITSTSTINAEFRPGVTFQDMVNVVNSTADTLGVMQISTAGMFTFWRASAISTTTNTFQTGGTIGIQSLSKSWLVA